MLLVVLYLLITKNNNFAIIIPIIALFALAGYRLMPAIQIIYNSISVMRYNSPAIESLYDEFNNLKPIIKKDFKKNIDLKKTISLNQIYFNYPNSSKNALKNLSFKIPACTTVGLVGATGSGKTTTADIILGLLEPQRGFIEIDNKKITEENKIAWLKSIGYVPQNIFLSDNSVAANIAFGVDPENIDRDSMINASKIANLHNFVMSDLPNQYETTIGERGIRLSGGQKQRIGIARALYHKPQVLIFDEATNALDNITEQAVMDAVNNLNKQITIILIAHRLNTVRNCDCIFFLENGELKGEGSFDELIKINSSFQNLTKIDS